MSIDDIHSGLQWKRITHFDSDSAWANNSGNLITEIARTYRINAINAILYHIIDKLKYFSFARI